MTMKGDQAFRAESLRERAQEMTYGGALSFLRRRYGNDAKACDVMVMGVPYDGAVTNRPGCRFGPRAIRAASTQLAELKAFPFGVDPFDDLAIADGGDMFLDPHHPETIFQAIEDQASATIDQGCTLLAFGGDHSVSFPLIKAHAKKYGPVSLLHFDAHCDTWEDSPGRLDHGTMFLRAVNERLIDVDTSIQVGLRTWNDYDAGFEVISSPWIHHHSIAETLKRIRKRVQDNPVYVSFDIDMLDPAYAPGTGTPVPGGLASWQALELIRGLSGLNLIGMDMVEVSPAYDHAEITALAAAHIAHDWLCVLAQNKK